MATTASAKTTTIQPDPTRWRALSIGLVGAFMVMYDTSMMNAILPTMQTALHMSPTQVTWATAGFSLAGAVTLVPAGRLGDDFGRRRMFVIGMILFLLASLSCALAPNGSWLVGSRFAMGIAGSIVIPQVIGLMQQLFTGKGRSKAFGVYAAIVAMSTAWGPLIAGQTVDGFGHQDGWRYVFFMGMPISLISLVLGYRRLPQTPHRGGGGSKVDFGGMALLALALIAIVLPLAENGDKGMTPPWWLLGVGAVLLAAFVLWERSLDRRGEHPMIKPRLLVLPSFSFSFITCLFFYAAFPPIFILLQLYFQAGLHYSALQSSLGTLLFPIGSMAGALISGRLVPRYGRRMVVAGCLMMTAGLAATSLLSLNSNGGNIAVVLAPGLLVCGLGAGFVISSNQSLGLYDIPRTDASTAGGTYQVGVKIGSAIGIPIATSVFFSALADNRGNFADAVAAGLAIPACMAFLASLVAVVGLVRTKQWGSREASEDTDREPREEAPSAAPAAGR
jgi:MFS family permease